MNLDKDLNGCYWILGIIVLLAFLAGGLVESCRRDRGTIRIEVAE